MDSDEYRGRLCCCAVCGLGYRGNLDGRESSSEYVLFRLNLYLASRGSSERLLFWIRLSNGCSARIPVDSLLPMNREVDVVSIKLDELLAALYRYLNGCVALLGF